MSRIPSSLAARLCALLVALLGAASLVLVAAPAHADGPLRVLLTGDSITQGRHDDYTWRFRLAQEIRRQGAPIDLVGSKKALWIDHGYTSYKYIDPRFDQDHFAKAAWELKSMVNAIGPEVAKQQPDVIVLEAGTNDLRHHDDDPLILQKTETALRAWIAKVQAAKPDVHIILSPVLSVDTALASRHNRRIGQYNADLPGIAQELSTYESQITIAPTNQGWKPASMTYDGVHPTPTGETLIAQRIAQAMQHLGFLPGAPASYRSVSWSPHHVPVVRFAGTRATVSWSRQATTGARIWIHRVGQKPRVSGRITSGRHAVTVVAGASYEFRLQLVRNRMTSTWGPIKKVVVTARPARVSIGATGARWTAGRGASSYDVQIRKIGQKRWTTKHTTGLRISATRVAAVKVRSVNASGHSVWRTASR